EAPVPTVVAAIAVVSHHEVAAGRDLAGKPAAVGIVVAVVPLRERTNLTGAHRRQHWIDGDRMLLLRAVAGDGLGELLHRLEPQAFQVAVRARGSLRPRLSVHRQLLVLVDDGIARQADHALDEILRWIQRITEDDDVAALRVGHGDDFLLEYRKS